ncbi:MAG: alpha/beta hydrolase [Roseiflexaceae bacterium]
MIPDAMPFPQQLAPFVRRAAVGSGELHYYDAGAGAQPPLVLVHGLGDEADSWRHVIPALAEGRRVIALDLPGFGRSDALPGGASITALARVVAGLLGVLGIDRATLVGSSLGAAVVQRLALARPALVERLVLVGGALPAQRSSPRGPQLLFLLPGLGELVYTSLRRSQDQAFATLRPYYYDFDALPPEDHAFLRERVWARVWSDKQRGAFLSALRWLALDVATRANHYRDLLGRVAVPTTLIWGDHDAIVPLAAGQQLAAALPSATLHTIPHCGHLPQQERAEAFVELVIRNCHS